MITEFLPVTLAAAVAFFFMVASPGPANIATALTSITQGRRAGLTFAAGVYSMSAVWALLAAAGVMTALATVPWVVTGMLLLGGGYLFYLGYKMLLAWRAGKSALANASARPERKLWALYLGGITVHATNPKAVLAWTSLLALATPPEAPSWWIFVSLAVLYAQSILIMTGYALIFSTADAVAIYDRNSRVINGIAAAIFVVLGSYLIITALRFLA